jgi:hypothetical protein
MSDYVGSEEHPCDFCGLPGLVWFEARPFTRRVPAGRNGEIHSLTTSRTGWAACACCAGSIRDDRWDIVTARTFTTKNLASGPWFDPEEAYRWIADLHLHIRDALTGISAPMILEGKET